MKETHANHSHLNQTVELVYSEPNLKILHLEIIIRDFTDETPWPVVEEVRTDQEEKRERTAMGEKEGAICDGRED